MFYRYANPENEVYRSDFKRRYSKENSNARLLNQDDAILNTKFIYSEEPNIRTNELYTMPHFRQTTSTTTEMNTSPVENNSILDSSNKSNVETNSVYMNFTITFSRDNANQSVEETTHVENTTESEETTETLTTTEEGTTADTTPMSSSTQSSTVPPPGQLFQDTDADEKAANTNFKMRGV